MRLTQYFTSPYTERALDRYREVVSATWSVAHKVDLYHSAKTAFDSDVSESDKQNAFCHIYDNLRSNWQVFRPKNSDECWNASQIYAVLINQCQTCSRQSGLTLATLTEQEHRASIEHYLRSLGKMKPTARYPAVYPWMAVAKFSHFFNPRLFAIYDTAFIWNKVANGTFKPDYVDFCRRRGFYTKEDSARFNLQYTLWSAEVIQNADQECMQTFADWFAGQAGEHSPTDEALSDVSRYYAAAFEMIAIGAAHL